MVYWLDYSVHFGGYLLASRSGFDFENSLAFPVRVKEQVGAVRVMPVLIYAHISSAIIELKVCLSIVGNVFKWHRQVLKSTIWSEE